MGNSCTNTKKQNTGIVFSPGGLYGYNQALAVSLDSAINNNNNGAPVYYNPHRPAMLGPPVLPTTTNGATLKCNHNHPLVAEMVPKNCRVTCDGCDIEIPLDYPMEMCRICNWDLCLNCVQNRKGEDPNLNIINDSIKVLLHDTPINVSNVLPAMEKLFKFSTKGCTVKALYHSPGLLDGFCKFAVEKWTSSLGGGENDNEIILNDDVKTHNRIRELAIMGINNLADTTEFVKPLVADPRIINILLQAVETGQTVDSRYYGLAAFTNILDVDEINRNLFENEPRILNLALQVATAQLKLIGDARVPAIGILQSFARQKPLRSRLIKIPGLVQCAIDVLALTETLDGGPEFNERMNEAYTGRCKEKAAGFLCLLARGDSDVKQALREWSGLVTTVQTLRADPEHKNPLELNYNLQDILYKLGISTRPQIVLKSYMTRSYHPNGSIGMGIGMVQELAPQNLNDLPHIPREWDPDSVPDRVVIQEDGTRIEWRLSRFELLREPEDDD
jgi:hypothetical protein